MVCVCVCNLLLWSEVVAVADGGMGGSYLFHVAYGQSPMVRRRGKGKARLEGLRVLQPQCPRREAKRPPKLVLGWPRAALRRAGPRNNQDDLDHGMGKRTSCVS